MKTKPSTDVNLREGPNGNPLAKRSGARDWSESPARRQEGHAHLNDLAAQAQLIIKNRNLAGIYRMA